jgi:hypothetical protein
MKTAMKYYYPPIRMARMKVWPEHMCRGCGTTWSLSCALVGGWKTVQRTHKNSLTVS